MPRATRRARRARGDYLVVEKDLMAAGGPDISRLHSGRSRQDIGSTTQRLITRDDFLTAFEKLNGMRDALLALAAQAPNAILPAYTWGVQAQPITLGHYISAYANAFDRQATRMREAYARLNQSPLGAAALGTSSFPVDRPRLAELLGFDAPVENSLDANQISPIDGGAELAGLATSGALTLGTFIADVTAQYAQTEPWIILTEGNETGVSSIMPQKRNPSGLVRLRAEASTLIGEAGTFALIAHNVEAGMSDYKDFGNPQGISQRDAARHGRAVRACRERDPHHALPARARARRGQQRLFHDDRARRHLAARGRRAVPDRASFCVGAGQLRPRPSPAREPDSLRRGAADLCRRSPTAAKMDTKLPLSEEQFRRSLTAENMVTASKGLGGPQPAEVARMLAARRIARRRSRVARCDAEEAGDASQKLDQAFAGCARRSEALVSRARCSVKRCSADPGPITHTGPRISGATLHVAKHPGHETLHGLRGELERVLARPRRFFFERCQTTPGKPFSGTSGSPV